MTSTTFFFSFIPILAFLLLAINLLLAPHNPYQEKGTVFECGFHSFLGQNRTQFSIAFFIFGLLFLLFDLEILLVYPFSVSTYTNDIYGLVVVMVFFVLLVLGFVFELGKSALTIYSRQTFSNDGESSKFELSKSSVAGVALHNLKVFILNIILNSKWNWLVNLVVLRIIKWPIYLLIANIIHNGIWMYCLYLFIGAIITYCFNLYIWDPYFKHSPAFKFLDDYIVDDLLKIGLGFFPLLVINYNTGGFASGFVLLHSSEFSTMPSVSPEMFESYRNKHMANLSKNWDHTNLLSNKKSLSEVLANSIRGDSEPNKVKRGLLYVLDGKSRRINAVKEDMAEWRATAKIMDATMANNSEGTPLINAHEEIGNFLDRKGLYLVCDQIYHEGKRTTTLSPWLIP